MTKINITCDICKVTHLVHRTDEIPEDVTELFCNWCPDCEDKANNYYEERYGYNPIPEPIDPNQTNLFPPTRINDKFYKSFINANYQDGH